MDAINKSAQPDRPDASDGTVPVPGGWQTAIWWSDTVAKKNGKAGKLRTTWRMVGTEAISHNNGVI